MSDDTKALKSFLLDLESDKPEGEEVEVEGKKLLVRELSLKESREMVSKTPGNDLPKELVVIYCLADPDNQKRLFDMADRPALLEKKSKCAWIDEVVKVALRINGWGDQGNASA